MIWWENVTKTNSYYFANLCGYSPKLHKPYGEYLEKLKKKEELNQEDVDLSWMDGLF